MPTCFPKPLWSILSSGRFERKGNFLAYHTTLAEPAVISGAVKPAFWKPTTVTRLSRPPDPVIEDTNTPRPQGILITHLETIKQTIASGEIASECYEAGHTLPCPWNTKTFTRTSGEVGGLVPFARHLFLHCYSFPISFFSRCLLSMVRMVGSSVTDDLSQTLRAG